MKKNVRKSDLNLVEAIRLISESRRLRKKETIAKEIYEKISERVKYNKQAKSTQTKLYVKWIDVLCVFSYFLEYEDYDCYTDVLNKIKEIEEDM